MSDQHKDAVIALLTRRPDLRMGQISDALDIDLAEIEACVSALVEAGDVMTKDLPVTAGGTVMVFRINPSSLAWKAPAAPMDVPTKELTKVDRAIAFLKKNGTSTKEALSEAMGINHRKSHPTSYLALQLKSGAVVRKGTMYSLGQPKAGSLTPAGQKAVDDIKRLVTEAATHFQTRLKPEPAPATIKSITDKVIKARKAQPNKPAPIANSVASSMSIGDLQIIAWTKGNLTLTANDNTVELAPVQAKALTAFIGLMEMTHD